MQIVPMENIHGREMVEAGNLCERKNGRGVDSNRNWPVHWGFREKDYDPNEEYPGTRPFRCANKCFGTWHLPGSIPPQRAGEGLSASRLCSQCSCQQACGMRAVSRRRCCCTSWPRSLSRTCG